MKKIVLLLIWVLTYSARIVAQNPVPNNGFENWSSYLTGTVPQYSYDMPDLWKTTDSITVANSLGITHSASKEISSIYAGSYSLNLQSWTFLLGSIPFLPGLPGCATNGDVFVDVATATISPINGSPDTIRHAQLNGFYKYAPVNVDTGSIEVWLFKRNPSTGNRDTVATGKYYFQSQGSYVQFSVPISQYGTTTLTPDSMLIWIQSSPRDPLGSGQTGSILLVDNLSFSGVIGVNEIPNVVNSVSVYPVPAINELTVDLDLKKNIHTSFEILDVSGKKMLTHQMNSLKDKVDISELSTGNYLYRLLDERGNKLSSGKFSVSK